MVQFQRCFHCNRLCTFDELIPGQPVPGTKLTRDHIHPLRVRKWLVPEKRKRDKMGHTPLFATVPSCFRCNTSRDSESFGEWSHARGKY